MRRHPAIGDQLRYGIYIDLAPDAFTAPPCVALQKAFVVKALADGVDPAPAQCHLNGVRGCDRGKPGGDFVDLDPYFGFFGMVMAEPAVKAVCIGEFMNSVGVNEYGCHDAAGSVMQNQRCRALVIAVASLKSKSTPI